ncbi:uncharacterized protein LOC143296210 [Babylonia areolata]|uniref:uncharacterized protein LOC143296210 n=1 Tax=Babylonia areolata TaxID=304850 RepID=UPI003FD3B31B
MSPVGREVTMRAEESSPLAFSTEIASSTASSIYVKWEVGDDSDDATLFPADVMVPSNVILGYRVHYQKVASSYVQYSHFLSPSVSSYSINNLVADTFYKVCVVMYRNDTSSPDRQCLDASTTSWHIPVSIGSSIGAVLALSIIVLIVLLSRCPSIARRHHHHHHHSRASASESSKYDSMTSSRYHDDPSDTTTQCHDHDDDVFSDSCCDSHHHHPHHHHHHHHHHPLDAAGRHYHHLQHYPYPLPAPLHALPERLFSGSRSHAFQGAASACQGEGGGLVSSPRQAHQAHHHAHRAHSLGACGRSQSLDRRSQSLERPRPHHGRRSRLLQLHSAHQSIQSEPAAPTTPRPLHVSISDLPPAVHISDPDAPVSSLLATPAGVSVGGGGGARDKGSLKDTPRTFHMSIDYDV